MENKKFNVLINFNGSDSITSDAITIVNGDYNSVELEFQISKDSLLQMFYLIRPDGTQYVTAINNNKVLIDTADIFNVVGRYHYGVTIYDEDSKLTNASRGVIDVISGLEVASEEVENDNNYKILDDLINKVLSLETTYNANATAKTNEFNTNAQNKLNEFNANAGSYVKTVLVNGVQQTITNNTVNINTEEKRVYGIRRKRANNTSSTWERTDNSVGLVANATKDGSAVENDFKYIYPWSKIISYNYDPTNKQVIAEYGDPNFKFDGSNGEVLTRFPKFYYKVWQDDTYDYIQISEFPLDGFILSPEFSLGRYGTSVIDGIAHSRSGVDLEVNRNISSFRTISKAVGDGFTQNDYHYFLYQLLYLVEYADYNSQKVLGSGVTTMRVSDNDKALVAETGANRIIVDATVGSYFLVGQQIHIGTSTAWNWSKAKYRTITSIESYNNNGVTCSAIYFDGDAVDIAVGNVIWSSCQRTGGTDSLGMQDGCLSNDGKHSILCNGVEDPFGNAWEFIDGFNVKDGVMYVSYNPENYVSDKFDGDYSQLGYAICQTTNSWAKTLGYDENNPLIRMTTEVGGSNSTNMCDYYYINVEGNRVLLAGGGYSGNTNAGLWYFDMTGTSSTTTYHIGSRLLRYQD